MNVEEELFLKNLEYVRKGDISWKLQMLEFHLERYKDELGKNASEKLKEAVIKGVRIQIEKLRKNDDDGDSYGISRAVKKYGISEEKSMFKSAWKAYFTRSIKDYIKKLDNDRADYNERDWFIKHKKRVNPNIRKAFEVSLEGYRERSGIKEFEEIDEITKKHGIDDWRWKDRKRKTLQLEIRLPYNLCGGFSTKVCEAVAKRYGGKVAYVDPYIPEDMSIALEDGYWYLEIPAAKKNLEVHSKKAIKARDEMEKMLFRTNEKIVKAAIEPGQRSLNLY